MSIVNELLQQANEAAEVAVDMNVASTGGGGRLYPVGYAFARLVGVLELGEHRVEYNGTLKDPAPQIKLSFVLYGDGYQNEDGSPGFISTYELNMSNNEKAKTYKLFKKLNYKGTAKTFAQLLGEAYLLKIIHYTGKAAGAKTRSIIDLEGFLPPTDPVTKQPYQIPAAPEDAYKLFLWERPTKAQWDSLYIDGAYDDGKSKNTLQERILAASNFPGSAIEQLIGGGGVPSLAVPDVPAAPQEAPAAPVSAPVSAPAAPAAPLATPTVPNVPQVPVAPAAPTSVPAADTPPWEGPATPAPVVPSAPVAPVLPSVPNVPAAPAVDTPWVDDIPF